MIALIGSLRRSHTHGVSQTSTLGPLRCPNWCLTETSSGSLVRASYEYGCAAGLPTDRLLLMCSLDWPCSVLEGKIRFRGDGVDTVRCVTGRATSRCPKLCKSPRAAFTIMHLQGSKACCCPNCPQKRLIAWIPGGNLSG